jgi:RNA-directed DNA polymerase
VVDADIAACFDTIDHTPLMDALRRRVGDKRVLALVKAFLKSGLLNEAGQNVRTETGTPQGGVLSPLLANIALSVLDGHFTATWAAMGDSSARYRRRRRGEAGRGGAGRHTGSSATRTISSFSSTAPVTTPKRCVTKPQ